MDNVGNLVTCTCGWVHFAVTRAYAEHSVSNFNEYYAQLDPDDRALFGRRAVVADYEHCRCCGGSYQNFRPAAAGDCPRGCTISPIIQEAPDAE